jgi:PD-(D/E)XK endonuclease
MDGLGLADSGGNVRAVRTHAARLGLDTSRLTRQPPPSPSSPPPRPQVTNLRTAGPTLAAAWFMLCGYQVLWPLEPCRYDLAVTCGAQFQRVQVKTATYQNDRTYVAHLSNSRPNGHLLYDVDEIDCFFVIDGDLNAYLIPHGDVSGYKSIYLRHYRNYLVSERGNWLQTPDANR